ncbi:hypothetical protein Hanom_Chr09g00867761 [Helianthus anomalus]
MTHLISNCLTAASTTGLCLKVLTVTSVKIDSRNPTRFEIRILTLNQRKSFANYVTVERLLQG